MNDQWQKKYLFEYNELISQFPSPEKIISDYIKDKFNTDLHWFHWADPNNLYFVQFSQSRSNNKSYTGWDHLGKYKTNAMTLTQAAMLNMSHRFSTYDDANSVAGIYKTSNADLFDEKNEAKMLPSEYLSFIYNCDFAGLYNKALSDYWSKYYERFILLLKNYYVSSILYLYKNNLVSKEEHDFAMAALNRENNISLFSFDIYGYYSSDIFLAENNERVMLFIPGAANPFLFSENLNSLRGRLKEIIKEPNNTSLLSTHFSLYDRQDGTSYSGVNTALNGIKGNNNFDESYFFYSPKKITEKNVFEAIAILVKKRSFSDGDVLITSNSEASKEDALNILQTILSMAPIFDVIIPEVSVPASLGILATSVGLSFDQLINGDTFEERRSAIPGVVTNVLLLGLSFAIPFIISKASANKEILNKFVSNEDNILNATNTDDFLKEYNINKDDISSTRVLEINIKETEQSVNIVKLSDEDNKIIAVKGSALSGIYYEADIKTGYEIFSRRVYRTEYNNEIVWVRGGGLNGGKPFDFKTLELPIFFEDQPYSKVASSELYFINDDSPLLFPNVDSRLPASTSEMEMMHFYNDRPKFVEQDLILMRGTTEEEAWNIASTKTAGGSNEALKDISIEGNPQTGVSTTAYTTDFKSADAASRRHFLVIVKVKLKYVVGNNEVSHVNHWAIIDEAPVEVMAVVDRRFLFPEPPSQSELSILQKMLRLRFFRKDIAKNASINFQKLAKGDINVLKGRGSISSMRQRAIEPYFISANADELQGGFYTRIERFNNSGYDRRFYNSSIGSNGAPTLNTYTGEILTDSSSLGSTYWKENNLTNNTNIIRVSNSARGANGIKIELEQVQANKPVIITSGNLSGCTTIVARKGGWLYKVHTGTTEPVAGFTSTTGVQKAVEVFKLLLTDGAEVPRVEGIMNNDFLVNYLADNFDESLITYASSDAKQGSIITVSHDNVLTFPYYTNDNLLGFGTSATILARVDNNTLVSSLSESYSFTTDGAKVSISKALSKKFNVEQ
ncbi:CNF1 family cytotoxic necrotizing factor [Photobacterium damselae]|uniref:CNF1 family cytotoxic necrotizing factor n=1 Tax=Photobacterium damselae TaxID=38293 RepID=UPI0040679A07